ncbi:MAG TPA: hypothetical protein VHH36_01470, partial [Candidatus Thermoplasmatota archaeon]|nr:hypothetical protein [Candidatus Thermoplasmatota archaeon]
MALLGLETGVKAGAALLLGVLALGLLLGARRKAPNAYAGAFVALLAANQAADLVRATATGETSAAAYRVATVFAALDPLFLYYFASLHPARNALQRPWPLALVALGSAGIALCAPLVSPDEDDARSNAVVAALGIFTTVVYAAVLVHLLRASPSRPGTRLLAIGLLLAWMPTSVRASFAAFQLFSPLHRDLTLDARGGLLLACFLAPLALAVALARRERPRADRGLGRAILASVALTFVVYALPVAVGVAILVGHPIGAAELPYAWLSALGSASASIRWIAFCGLASVALLRDDLLGLRLRLRRRVARALVAAGFVAAALLAVLAWDDANARPP